MSLKLDKVKAAENPLPFIKMNPGCQLQLAMHTLSLDLQGITSTDEIVCRCIDHSINIHKAYGFYVYPAINEEFDLDDCDKISAMAIKKLLAVLNISYNNIEVLFSSKPKVVINYDASKKYFDIPDPEAISSIRIYSNDEILGMDKTIEVGSLDKQAITIIRILASMIKNCTKSVQLSEEDLDLLF